MTGLWENKKERMFLIMTDEERNKLKDKLSKNMNESFDNQDLNKTVKEILEFLKEDSSKREQERIKTYEYLIVKWGLVYFVVYFCSMLIFGSFLR